LESNAVAQHTERRIVTVLFGDLSDFTAWAEDLDPERVGRLTDRVLAALAQSVTAFGGTVDKLTGDGIMAVFGAPVAHEDDPERAVRCALAMQRAVRRAVDVEPDEASLAGGRRLGLRVGINTGEVVAGVQAGMSYTVIGDTVNTAARLSDAADVGGVYVGAHTARATRSRTSYRRLTPLRLKGKRGPVEAYELLGLRDAPGVRPGLGDEAPFVGRESELGRIVGRFAESADRGEPHVLLVTADAGMGKTRLAAEVARAVRQVRRARVLGVRCSPWSAASRLQPLADLVRVTCGVETSPDTVADLDDRTETSGDLDPAGASRAAERVRRLVDRAADGPQGARIRPGTTLTLLDLLRLTRPVRPPQQRPAVTRRGVRIQPMVPVAAEIDPAGRLTAPAAVAGLLAGLAGEGPVLVIIDDLHHAGADGIRAIADFVAALSGPVLVLLLGRSELVRGAGVLNGFSDAESVPLPPLAGAAAARLLRSYLGGGRLPDRESERLLATAQGNPFWLAEIVSLLIEQGRLTGGSDGWRLVEPALDERLLSSDLAAVLTARIDTLSPTVRQVLRDAAVVGDRVPPGAVEALRGITRAGTLADEVEHALAELVSRRMLRRRDGGYAFVTALLRQAAYSGVGKADLADRHARLVAWGARRRDVPNSGLTAGEWDSFIAGHAERAVALADAMRLPGSAEARASVPAGVAALERLASAALDEADGPRAAAFLDRSDELIDSPGPGETTPLIRLLRARTLLAAGQTDQGLKVANELALEAGVPPSVRGGAMLVVGEARRAVADNEAAKTAWRSALALGREHGLDRIVTEALRRLGMLEHLTGQLLRAEEQFGEAYDLAVRGGDAPGQGWALQHLAWSATSRGAFVHAEHALARAAELFVEHADVPGRSWVRGTESFVRLLQGRLVEAREAARAFLPYGERSGDRWGVAVLRTVDAFAAAELGELGYARQRAEEVLADLVHGGDDWSRSLAMVVLGVADRGLGRNKQAVARLTEAERVGRRAAHPLTVGIARTIRGYCRLDAGDPAAAERDARTTLQRLAPLELDDAARVGPVVLLAQARRAQGDVGTALKLLAGVVGVGGAGSLLFPLRQAVAHYAGTLLDAGRVEESVTWARKALSVPAEDVRSRVVALRALAIALAAAGDQAGAVRAAEEAVALSYGTEQVSERWLSDSIRRSL
jgi:class 3 adenylate cyclase